MRNLGKNSNMAKGTVDNRDCIYMILKYLWILCVRHTFNIIRKCKQFASSYNKRDIPIFLFFRYIIAFGQLNQL